jgi:hypothetical protein
MNGNAFDALIGLRLSIVRRAADMLVVHFGEIRPHHSGQGTVGLSGGYALLVFPAGHRGEEWRYFIPGSRADHLVFPTPAGPQRL